MLKHYFGWIVPVSFSLLLTTGAVAQSQGLKKGPEISADRKSEQGLEHGKAYAGTKEKKKDEEQYNDQNVMNKAKRNEVENKVKEEESKKDNLVKQEKEKLKKQKDKSTKMKKSKNKI